MKQYSFNFILKYNGALTLLLLVIIFFLRESLDGKTLLSFYFIINSMFTMVLQAIIAAIIHGLGKKGTWPDMLIFVAIPLCTPLLYILAINEQHAYPNTQDAFVLLPIILYPALVITL